MLLFFKKSARNLKIIRKNFKFGASNLKFWKKRMILNFCGQKKKRNGYSSSSGYSRSIFSMQWPFQVYIQVVVGN